MPSVIDRARLVAAELVANAVEHAGTDIVLVVSRRDTGVHLAVSDGDTELPHLARPGDAEPTGDDRSRGLGVRIVDAATSVWGALPTSGGKVVWAILRKDP
ncbi:ATP-binding protein [Actinoplanes sp. NEAU-A12]|uniref:ATP-binding protein n=2 Tax=Actinoplanes sandaracinus TaxID=3045177 RepID=A0ABT6WYE2_9ACTN|nr:ATP-binding protein [Actinoplanes sandaracinus]MDI6104754.1 ATP-binding protein [Actinoplanes sandaracinus]